MINEGDVIESDGIIMRVGQVLKNGFEVEVVSLEDKDTSPGHFGSYIAEGRHYYFRSCNQSEDMKIWEIPYYSTERYHKSGSVGAQFLLFWFDDSGYSFELDS